jgi:hypothetical protein
MSEDQIGIAIEAEARASARRHTARLLKMLRGFGPTSEPPPAAESGTGAAAGTPSRPATIAEAAPAYARFLEVLPGRPSPPAAEPGGNPSSSPVVSLGIPPSRSPRWRDGPGAIPAAGEYLRRQQGMLGRLMARADRLNRCNQIFRAYLPAHLRDHVVLVSIDPENWTVHTDSASWATRLRYALHNIRQALGHQLGIPLPKPCIRVIPTSLPPRPRRPRPTLTEQSAKLLEITARNVPDARLGAALRRLAAHAGPGRDSDDKGS